MQGCSQTHPPHALMSTPLISIMRTGPFTLSAGGSCPRSTEDDATCCLLLSVSMTWLTAAPDLMTALQRSSIACGPQCHGVSALCHLFKAQQASQRATGKQKKGHWLCHICQAGNSMPQRDNCT